MAELTELEAQSLAEIPHPSLGSGVVVSSQVRSDDEEVTVAFPDKGVKKLMASFAKLAKA